MIKRLGSRKWQVRACVLAASGAALTLAVTPRLGADLAAQTQQPGEVVAEIIGGAGNRPKYAVPDFVAVTPDVADVARTLGQVLWDDLNFEREFYMIPRDTYSTVPPLRAGAPVPFAAWQELGADALVQGTVSRAGDQLRVEYRLFNVRSQQQVASQQYEGAARNPRRLAHTISDAIFLQQRNLKGVARTKLAFISDRNREPVVGTVEKREGKEVYVSDYDGANEQRITVSRLLNLNPSWSPDARAIAYGVIPNAPGTPDIVVSRIYEGVLQRPAKGIGNNYLPSFSPDGTRIAFTSTRDGNMEIYVVNLDGSGLRNVTRHPSYDSTPTWSPSGNQIAFTSDRTGRPQIYVMNVDGTGGQELVSVGESEADRPTWSPAPFNKIAFTARRGSWYDIRLYDVASRTKEWLTDNGQTRGSNESPAFSPTGRHIAFTSTRTGSSQIFVMDRKGENVRQVTRTGNNQTPSWSPN